MSKRSRRPRTPSARKPRRPAPHAVPRSGQPDLVDEIAAAMDDDPLALLGLASAVLAAVDERSHHPLQGPVDVLSREMMVDSLLAAPLPETSALLTAMAALSGDQVLKRRVHREVTDRAHPLPPWLADLDRAAALPRAVEVTHALGDGDDVLISVEPPGGHPLTAVVYIDHNMGTLVKDAFVVPAPLDDVVAQLRDATEHDPDTTARPLAPADARARIVDAVELGAMSFPPIESDTWPACRPLVEWMVGLLPAGGTGYQRPDWDDDAVADLTERFLAAPLGAEHTGDEARALLGALLWFGTEYGPGDPMRWSPTAVEILLLDWIPRKIVDDPGHLAAAPALLRALIRFCHQERGIRESLTEQTLAAVDALEPEYRQIIRSERPQGPPALLAAVGVLNLLDGTGPGPSELMLDSLRRAVGGEDALDALDADPLPVEPFAWDAVPADVHGRVGEVLELVERCCTELLDEEYRTVCRRLLADAVAGDPEIFRRRGRADTAAAAICWIAGKANSLFDGEPVAPKMMVRDIVGHFGITGSTVSQRSGPLLRAIGADQHRYGEIDLHSPRYLTGPRRRRILALRDRYRAGSDVSSTEVHHAGRSAARADDVHRAGDADTRSDVATVPDAALVPLAHGCPLMVRARALAGFVGEGRALTAKGVLRRAEVGPACAAAGLPDPGRVVTAADVPDLHRGWVAAQGAGLLVLGLHRAVAATPSADPLTQWLGGMVAVLRAESDDRERIGATVVCRATLRVLDAAEGIDRHRFAHALDDVLERLPVIDRLAAVHAFRRGTMPEDGALEVLAECGAIDPATLAVTPLGRWALGALAEPPAPAPTWDDDDVLQLKISLDGFRPPVWRRVLAPAGTSLGLLHRIVQIALEWDDDHLHVFTVDGVGYADVQHGLDGCGDEDTLTLASALPRPGAALSYRYDLGDCWDHTILLEKVLPADPDARFTCVGGRGDAPVEDWGHDEPPPAQPFDAAEIDARLARLRAPRPGGPGGPGGGRPRRR